MIRRLSLRSPDGRSIVEKEIGSGVSTFIIAEVGVNHNGDVDLALRLVAEAKKAGADCVKFQTFSAERVVTKGAPKAAYQLETTDKAESQFEMLKNVELSEIAYQEILDGCRREEILFLSTPYSVEDVDFLEKLNVPAYKIASGQVVEHFFLQYVARKGKPIILSTGMCTLGEVDAAVRAIRDAGNNDLILLQCTTNYPSPIEDANLRAMCTMSEAFGIDVGYSDHTQSSAACVAAVALGACIIEKHITLDKSLPGPDHSSSATPDEFREMVRLVRETEQALGDGVKQPSAREAKNISGMRRSLVAKRSIKAGETISLDMLACKRPALGLSPSLASEVTGHKAAVEIPKDTFITWKDLLVDDQA